MHTYNMIKVDADYALVRADETEIPAAGSIRWYPAPGQALRQVRENIDEGNESLASLGMEAVGYDHIEIVIGDHASEELIRKYGFTPVS